MNNSIKINLILLAAGNSTRFNGNKLIEMINEKPMYMNVIEKVIKLKFNKIILVTQYEVIKEALLNYPIEVVMNNESALGISHSIKLGINADLEADAYMFMVCDQPFISLKSIEKLINSYIKGNKGMACATNDGNLGNPTIFSAKYKEALLNLKGDVGGKAVMKKHLEDLERVEISDKAELMDIDSREEMEKLI